MNEREEEEIDEGGEGEKTEMGEEEEEWIEEDWEGRRRILEGEEEEGIEDEEGMEEEGEKRRI